MLRAWRASMRPRPDATENLEAAEHRDGGGQRASMRPRPDATENLPRTRATTGRRPASMRPRPDATENACMADSQTAPATASMRPRPDATENAVAGRPAGSFPGGFNEAAARCHGKLANAAEISAV